MDIKLPEDLHLQVCKIRNIEVWHSDILPLHESGVKIPSTALDAYGAQFQQLDEDKGDYTIFSSWIGAFLSGIAKERKAEGTIEEHIRAAVSFIKIRLDSPNMGPAQSVNDMLDMIQASRCWIILLCGGQPLHWILA